MPSTRCHQVTGVWGFVEGTRRGRVGLFCWAVRGRMGFERENPRRLQLLNRRGKRCCSHRRCTGGRRGNANRCHKSAGLRHISSGGTEGMRRDDTRLRGLCEDGPFSCPWSEEQRRGSGEWTLGKGDRGNLCHEPTRQAGLSLGQCVPLVAALGPYWKHTVQLAFGGRAWAAFRGTAVASLVNR